MARAERHVLGLSGGRDSAALAVFMRQNHPELNVEYFFTDTGKELPEVYEYLVKLEGFLGKPILRLNPDRDFESTRVYRRLRILRGLEHEQSEALFPGGQGTSRTAAV